ncbi:HNH endonuclease signature motif containing protein [Cellulomonas fengjieae]|uniref:DUF222 domain-containing protein n=1 Tax=Cellulomonas fengjieae TaxID=2819978 RepID=A0ABS3SM68_9CELL|nr:HNH endonuclease signature motif containing protein [Cellulomonas fengjieae]MBO3086061.1 DUF222 domain-containing protein [Cellulomonas fengjieae]QVI65870.1 DUF222 domain-containing protein [Cellulomonas fengjieae]
MVAMTATLLDGRLDAADVPTTMPARVRVAGLADLPEPSVAGGDVGVLATMLGSVAVADLSDVALVNAVAAWQRVLNMAQAAQAEVVREIEARTVDALARVPDELACALVCTRRAAQDLFLRAWGAGQHPAVADAWAAGAIDARKVDVILAETAQVEAGAVRAVVADAVEQAVELTAAQLTRHLRASVIGSDPAAAEARRVAERARRGVFLDLAPDAMARLIAYLPAAEATAAFTVIDALAGNGAPDSDPRPIDQRRADAFADVFTTILDRQATLDGTPLPSRHGQRAALQVSVAATTLLGLDDHPATLGSYGPIPAQVARELAQDATWRRILTDPAGQVCAVGTTAYRPGADLTRTVIARDVTCTFPGCRQPATRCELDHRIPYDHSQARREHDADPQTCLENLHALCKHHHQAKTTGWWQVTWDKNTGISTWTDRHGLTYARHPIPVHTTPTAAIHRPPPPPPPDPGDPPF